MRPSSSPSHRLLAIAVHQHRERRAVGADRRLDHVRHDSACSFGWSKYSSFLPEILLVLREVEVAAIVDALDLLEAERAAEVELRCRTPRARSARAPPACAGGTGAGPARARATGATACAAAFQYSNHSMSVPGSTKNCISICSNSRVRKMKLPGRDLVAERLADLRDAERHLLARRLLHVQEVHEDALRRLRAQVDHGRAVLDRPHERLEHEVEQPRLGELALLVRSPGRLLGLRGQLRILELVGAEARLARLAVDQRIGEAGDVAARLPDARVHQDRRVEPLDVVARADHRVPPAVLEVLLQLDAERAVVPDRSRCRRRSRRTGR